MNAHDAERPMYHWRQLTPEQRQELLHFRRDNHLPWHSPPHYDSDSQQYMVTAATYEHRAIIGQTLQRLADFEAQLLDTIQPLVQKLFAWTVLPNHYHVLVHA